VLDIFSPSSRSLEAPGCREDPVFAGVELSVDEDEVELEVLFD
jgi:hypothetical protein